MGLEAHEWRSGQIIENWFLALLSTCGEIKEHKSVSSSVCVKLDTLVILKKKKIKNFTFNCRTNANNALSF